MHYIGQTLAGRAPAGKRGRAALTALAAGLALLLTAAAGWAEGMADEEMREVTIAHYFGGDWAAPAWRRSSPPSRSRPASP